MTFCWHAHQSRPFAKADGTAYKVCFDCGYEIRASLWDRTAPGVVDPHRTQDRSGLTPLTGIEKREMGISE